MPTAPRPALTATGLMLAGLAPLTACSDRPPTTTATLTAAQPAAQTAAASEPAPDQRPRVLVFTKTAGFRHDSIPDGIAALQKLGERDGYDVTPSEDPALFHTDHLDSIDAVVFLSTTGDILNAEQEAAFQAFIQRGGAFVGIHAAADTEYDWPWYGQLVGAYFSGHPEIQNADIDVLDNLHESTRMLPARWTRRDEWYNYKAPPADGVRVLLNLDERSYTGGTMGSNHPIAWYHEFEGGRSFYTGGGHTKESFAEDLFLEHLAGALRWALGMETDPAPQKPE